MSTRIKTKGIKADIKLTRFWGGVKRGRMLQITINGEYIQLTEKETIKLAKILSNSFNDKIYPSE